jgi:hypothetical protein
MLDAICTLIDDRPFSIYYHLFFDSVCPPADARSELPPPPCLDL